MKRFLKLVINPFENENRDLRELAIVREMGHEIIVIAKGEINEITTVEGFTVHRRTTCILGSRKFKFLIAINRILSELHGLIMCVNLKPIALVAMIFMRYSLVGYQHGF